MRFYNGISQYNILVWINWNILKTSVVESSIKVRNFIGDTCSFNIRFVRTEGVWGKHTWKSHCLINVYSGIDGSFSILFPETWVSIVTSIELMNLPVVLKWLAGWNQTKIKFQERYYFESTVESGFSSFLVSPSHLPPVFLIIDVFNTCQLKTETKPCLTE